VPAWEAFVPVRDKNYRSGGRKDDDHRYEPPRGIDFLSKRVVFDAPDLDKATTAHVERLNGTTRHFVGRMRRLSYAFSKTLAGHKAAMALHYTHYNWCHVVRTLRVTPAMQAGLTDHVWDLGELMAALLAAPPCERPEKVPLTHRTPEGTGRGCRAAALKVKASRTKAATDIAPSRRMGSPS